MRLLTIAGIVALLASPLSAQPVQGKKYALLVGVAKYDGTGLTNLKYAEKDMTDLKAALAPLGYQVTLMTKAEYRRTEADDIDPTAENVVAQLKKVARLAKPEDTVLVAFSGHGVHLKGPDKLFYCPTKPNLDKPETLVAIDDILAALKPYDAETQLGCRATSKVVLVDACRNDPTDGKASNGKLESMTRPLVAEPPGGTVALFSCSKGQISHESEKFERGFMMHFVIDGLKGKAANKSGELSWDKLVAHVKEEVPAAVLDQKGAHASQLPESKGQSNVLNLGRRSYEYDLTGGFRFAHFGEDGRILVIARSKGDRGAYGDGKAYVIDAISGKNIAGPFEHKGVIRHACFNLKGTMVATASDDGEAKVWDVVTGKLVAGPMKHEKGFSFTAFSPDGSNLATASFDGISAVWDVKSGKQVIGPLQHSGNVRHVVFSPDGSLLAATSNSDIGPMWSLWNTTTGLKAKVGFTEESLPEASRSEGKHIVFSPDGSKIIASSCDYAAIIWDVKTGKRVGIPLKHTDVVLHAGFSPDGSKVVTASGDETAAVWDTETGKMLAGPFKYNGSVFHAAFSPDGSKIVTSGVDQISIGKPGNYTAIIWDAETGAKIAGPFNHEDPIRAMFSKDGSMIVTRTLGDGASGASLTMRDTATVWDVKTGKKLGSATAPKP